MKILLFILLLISIEYLYPQTSINGKITNPNDKPIEFATVQLISNTKTIQSTITDSLGNYYFKVSKNGSYELVTRCLGYYSGQKKITLKNDTTVNFVLKVDTTILNEVAIVAQKDLIQSKSDRYIVNISGNIETKGKETTDILKQLPNLNISQQALNIFGKSSVIVYINDRIVRLQGQSLLNYLNSLPPDIINSIEIITTPPAEYDAQNNVGIVKIVTKKNINPGWKEYFMAGYIKNTYSSYMISAYTNYTGKKLFFDLNLTNANYSFLNQNNYYSYFPDETITTFNPKKWTYIGTNAQLNFGYDFNENTSVIADFQIPFQNKEIISDIENKTDFINSDNNQVDSTIYSNGKTIKRKYTYNSEMFLKHLFPNKKSYYTANIAYLNNYTQNSREFTSITQKNNTNLKTEDYYTEGSQNYNILTSKLDFSLPLFNCTVNTGFKLSFIETNSSNNFYNTINYENILDTALSNKYSYTENVQALYYSMEKNLKKWSFKIGIRSEITQTIGNSLKTNEQHNNDYIDFFPTIYVTHKLDIKNKFSFSYAKRIERPPYQYLDPFKWYITKYDYAMGNPFLKPSYINSFELTYFYNNTFSSKIYYTYQDDKIGRYVVLDSLNIENQTQKTDNFLNVNSFGVNIYKFLKINKKIETVLQGNFEYSDYTSNKKEFSNTSGINGTAIINNTINLNDNFQMVCNLEEKIPGLYDYRTMNNSFKLDIGFNFIYNKKGLETRLLVADIFKTANPEYHYVSGGIKQTYKNYYDTRMLKIILVWRPGNWYNKTSKISSPSNIEEKQRL
jgi:hypothetical protein